MKIKLLDSNEFEKVESFLTQSIDQSFNINVLCPSVKTWSNGWCTCSELKIDREGSYYMRISNEIPKGIYNNLIINPKIAF